jgi:serine/threonine-protein kinase
VNAPTVDEKRTAPVVCPSCAKVLEGEPNFCPACGADMRGLGGSSDTLDGPAKQTIDGRYKVLEKLGEENMGSVYKVEHVRMGKLAALKLLRPDHAVDKGLKARFLQEARVVAKLSHPNTVQVFDSGELDDGSLFITMEYVPGKDLAWQLKAHGALSEAQAISIGVQILSSLQEAHEAGIVHRDIKPANVMLVRRRKGGDDQVKLLDFGIAKLQEAEGRKSITGDFVGTPAYMSPEQIRGEDVDARSDLYSLGALLFELVTGKQMFDGPTPITIINLHTQGEVPRVAEVNPAVSVRPTFEGVLRRALSKRAAERYRDADAMRAALEALRPSAEPVRSASYTPMPDELSGKMLSREDFDAFERTLRFQRTFTPVAVLAVLVMLGAFGWKALASRPPPAVLTQESEPNDDPREANHIAPGTDVTGSMGASKSEFGDRDLFVVDVPGGPTRVTLSGVPDLNLTLEVLQLEKTEEGDTKLRRKVFIDDVGTSGGERLEALWLSPGPVWLRVQERPFCTEPNRPPRERALVPYTLRVEPMQVREQSEVEPNDTPSTAQVLSLTSGHAVTAFAGERLTEVERANVTRPDAAFSSPDFFRVDLDEGESAVLAIVPPVRGALSVTVLDEAEPKRTRVLEVKTTPTVLELKGAKGGRRLRVIAGKDTLPGDAWLLAVGSAEKGAAALVDLANALHDDGRDETRRLLVDAALQKLPGATELSRLEH